MPSLEVWVSTLPLLSFRPIHSITNAPRPSPPLDPITTLLFLTQASITSSLHCSNSALPGEPYMPALLTISSLYCGQRGLLGANMMVSVSRCPPSTSGQSRTTCSHLQSALLHQTTRCAQDLLGVLSHLGFPDVMGSPAVTRP